MIGEASSPAVSDGGGADEDDDEEEDDVQPWFRPATRDKPKERSVSSAANRVAKEQKPVSVAVAIILTCLLMSSLYSRI